MNRFTRMAWWALPIAVALTGSVAVGATVSQTVNRNASSLPVVTVPTAKAAGATGPALRGSKGIVLGGRSLVPGLTPTTGASPTTMATTPSQGWSSGSPEGDEPGSDNEDETPTSVAVVPPPTVVTVDPGEDNDDDEDDRQSDQQRVPATSSSEQHPSQASASEDD